MTDKTKKFLEKLKNSGNWNDEYDYSKVDYINSKDKIIIVDLSNNTQHLINPQKLLYRGTKCTQHNLITEIINYNDFKILVIKLNIKTQKEYFLWSKTDRPHNVPSNPNVYYKEWEGWPTVLNTKNSGSNKTTYYDYSNFKNEIKKLNINNSIDYSKLKNKCFINLPHNPKKYYGDLWEGWDIINNTKFISFNEWVKYIRPMGLNNSDEYKNFCNSKRSLYNIPRSPYTVYRKEWKGWDYVINNKIKITYNELVEYIQPMNLKSCDEYYDFYKKNISKFKIPYTPHKHYSEWVSWGVFLGYQLYNNRNNRIYLLNKLGGDDLLYMDPFEIYTIIGQGKLPTEFGDLTDTEAGSNERITTIQQLKDRLTTDINTNEETEIEVDEQCEMEPINEVDDEITHVTIHTPEQINEPTLPSVRQIQDLHTVDNELYATMDKEAFEALVQYKLRKLWNNVLNNEISLESLKNESGGPYFESIKEFFFNEYDEALNYKPKEGYSFQYQPNLMQKLTVQRLLKAKSYGNWSGTGAGKTLSFIVASREIESKLTLIIALNSTIKQTCNVIKDVYPNSVTYIEYSEDYVFDRTKHNYLVLNYEKFQQTKSEELFQNLTNNNQIDFVVIDEVHNAKQGDEGDEHESIRRGVMTRLLGRIRENNSDVYTLVMSATPVINNLFEAKSLLSLMTGLEYDDLNSRRTLPNALKIFQQLILHGLRYIPKYDIEMTELTGNNMSNLNIDGSHLLDTLLNMSSQNYVTTEKLLLPDKLKAIQPYLRKGVIIYSYLTTGFINEIKEYVTSLGYSAATYSGEESTFIREENLNKFISGEVDILIGSDPIGTGVDGLQSVCDRMIIITLPWTDSKYVQLKGRIYRQGSEFGSVEIIIPQVRIQLEEGEIWSWDVQRLNLIKNKKTLADAAVDGIVPSRILPSRDTMFRKSQESLLKWKERVNEGNIIETEREIIKIDLYPGISDSQERERRLTSELSEFNRRGKTTLSSTMHKEFSTNPESWFRYHKLRKERMDEWDEIPYEYIATKIKNRNHVIIDFGCGENLFKDCIPNNKVISFDHVSVDGSVIACDIKDISEYVENESVDVAIFSLALWGTNYKDYITEAHRVLNYGGVIHIAEPAKSYETLEDEQELIDLITESGFTIVGHIERRSKFIYISGIKM